MIIKANTQIMLPVLMVSSSDFLTRNTRVVYGSVTCNYLQAGSISWTSKSITNSNWTEIGNGIYMITFLNTDISSNTGLFVYNLPLFFNTM